MSPLPRPCLCLVTNRRATAPDARTETGRLTALERALDDAIDAGIDLIQIRERDLDAATLLALVRLIADRAAGSATRIVVNDRPDIVMAIAQASVGVHLGADGPETSRIRALIGADRLVGRSVHLPIREWPSAAAADYLVFGTVFRSESKPAGTPIAGLEGLREACRSTTVPILAIGGVTPERASACIDAGAAGIAAIGAFLPASFRPGSAGTRAAVAAFRAAFS
jgi:thiamine-phosphate pyrophosphorylase